MKQRHDLHFFTFWDNTTKILWDRCLFMSIKSEMLSPSNAREMCHSAVFAKKKNEIPPLGLSELIHIEHRPVCLLLR